MHRKIPRFHDAQVGPGNVKNTIPVTLNKNINLPDCAVRDPASNHTVSKCVYQEGHCSIQPWPLGP